jgi:hypothetical protein
MDTEVLNTNMGPLIVTRVQMQQLEEGDHLVGPTGKEVYRVTTDCHSNSRGWLHVVDLTAPQDTNPNGFFSYSLTTEMYYVIPDEGQD